MPEHLLNEDEIRELKATYMSDNTAYMKWSTEIEPKKNMTDADFFNRNRILLLFADKFAPLANFTEPRMMALHKLKMLNHELAEAAGMTDVCEKTAISAIDDIQISRGNQGFFQRAIITQRHELQEQRTTETQKKIGLFNRFFGGKQPPQQQGERNSNDDTGDLHPVVHGWRHDVRVREIHPVP